MDDERDISNTSRDRVRRYRQLRREILDELRNHDDQSRAASSNDYNQLDDEPMEGYIGHARNGDSHSDETRDAAITIDNVYQAEQSDNGGDDFGGSEASANYREMNAEEYAEEPDEVEAPGEIEQIRKWAIECNIKHTDLDKILQILSARLLPQLPKTSKTFLKTNTVNYDIREIRDEDDTAVGKYFYIGISKGLQQYVNPILHPDNIINLQINVDGIPLFASSKVQLWPILCRPFSKPDVYKPFIVAVYCGESKPHNVNVYLEDFVNDINELLNNGILISGIQHTVHLHCFICDTPARSFMKLTKGHGGFSACERCTVRGVRVQRRTVYVDINCPERTDESFRHLQNPEHHNGVSILTTIEPRINMVTSFVLDFMHLCCIGVMKRLLVGHWLTGDLRNRLGRRSKMELSRRLESLHSLIPMEFQRKPRNIQVAALWKATEYRFFLLYCGPVVLQKLLPANMLKHFLLFHVACRILCTDELAERYNALAKLYLRTFLEILPTIYGPHSAVLNMHHLIHLADDAANMECSLSSISGFPFESFLGRLKKLVRTPNAPLEQICRRLHEQSFIPTKVVTPDIEIKILKRRPHIVNGNVIVLRLQCKRFVLTPEAPDNVILLNDNRVMMITKIFFPDGLPEDLLIQGVLWNFKRPIFTYPLPSNQLHMWELRKNHSGINITCSVQDVKQKIVKLSLSLGPRRSNKVYAIPFLHM